MNFRPLGEGDNYIRHHLPPPSLLNDNIRLGGFCCPQSSLAWENTELPTKYKTEHTVVINVEDVCEIPVLAVDAWVLGRDDAPQNAIVERYTNHQVVVDWLADSSKPRLLVVVWTLIPQTWSEIAAMGCLSDVRSIAVRSEFDDLVIGYKGEEDLIMGPRSRVDFAKRSADGAWTTGMAADDGGARNYEASHGFHIDRGDVLICLSVDQAEKKEVYRFPEIR